MMTGLASCTDPSSGPLVPQEPFLAKGGAGPSVSATTPPYGYQGEATKQVTITGSGFTAGAAAAWERNGAPDPKVTVIATQYVSSTQLVATISIAADADLALYDVSVTNPDRKKGIGTSMFEVTTAEVLGTLDAAVNDLGASGAIVGYAGNSAFVYEDGTGMVVLSAGQGWGTDPLGTMVLGRTSDFAPAAWVKQVGGSYVMELLPNPGGGGGNVQSGARDGGGTLIVAGADAVRLSRRETANRPAVWTRVGSGWSAPVIYAHPGTRASIRDINGSGGAVGVYEAEYGLVWENASSYVVLDGMPEAINEAGTVIVGERNGAAGYWVRNAVSGAWNPVGITLPNANGLSCTGSVARDVNDDGVIVGLSCGGNGRLATVWRLDMSGSTPVLTGGAQALPGLGGKGSDASAAVGVSRSAPYVAAGSATLNGKNVVVRWGLP